MQQLNIEPMLVKFTKMQAIGNDFVVIDNLDQRFDLSVEQRRLLADRHFGVGCDQILLIEAPSSNEVDFNYRIFNADGGEVEQCGNGACCFARYVRENAMTDKNRVRVQTIAGVMEFIINDEQVTVNMGKPNFDPVALPFKTDNQADYYRLQLSGQSVEFGAVSVGNPHICIKVSDIDKAPLQRLALLLQQRSEFPAGVNVGFMQIENPNHIRLRVFERGVGETKACGSGAVAAVVIGRSQGLLEENVKVDLPGGQLGVQWKLGSSPVLLTGPAEFVFTGQINL